MISDLLDILKAIQSAQDSDQKAILERQLKERVEAVLHKFFDDGEAEYPRRKRTFQAIRTHIGIFDENPQGLKEILFAMGANRSGSDGDDGYWHLPKTMESGASTKTATKKRMRINWPMMFGGLGVIAAAIAILEFVFDFFEPEPDMPTTFRECIATGDPGPERRIECLKKFPP